MFSYGISLLTRIVFCDHINIEVFVTGKININKWLWTFALIIVDDGINPIRII
ncbi:hypothetical protein YPPY32_1184 [Yersinia pestis PY-32]|nr:hypothetical protein YPPY11_1021 [Yersinia pestis PY-11]EIR66451.1 hypothetical protein YPPY19_0957 [Yersinia pestis PY-19]EIR82564.1 hypothetical protein YPPY32_1184 [Yersinia pestis PY-32]EIS49599.1 hypothetical protein YPPY59_0956 [Yersinia pestis PY-59]